MENNLTSSQQLGEKLSHYANKLGEIQRMLNKLNLSQYEYIQLVRGESDNLTKYVDCFAYMLRRLVPMKVKLKVLPATLPSRNEIEAMMLGAVECIEDYTSIIDTLLLMPDLPRKKVRKMKMNQPISLNKKSTESKRRVVDYDKFRNWPKGDVVIKERQKRYGMESQITRKEWGSPNHPARI